jgi:hypothetical protein
VQGGGDGELTTSVTTIRRGVLQSSERMAGSPEQFWASPVLEVAQI